MKNFLTKIFRIFSNLFEKIHHIHLAGGAFKKIKRLLKKPTNQENKHEVKPVKFFSSLFIFKHHIWLLKIDSLDFFRHNKQREVMAKKPLFARKARLCELRSRGGCRRL